MTQIADIAVKNGSNTAETFKAYQPQSGSDPAVFLKPTTESRDHWPSLTSSTRRTANKAVKTKTNLNVPYFNSVTGAQAGNVIVTIEYTIPDTAPLATIGDAYAYASSVVTSSLFADQFKTQSALV